MNRYILLIVGILLGFQQLDAQESVEQILQQIERNNPELKANQELMKAQIWDTKSTNNLANPTVSFSQVWDSKNKSDSETELEVMQEFEFPTAYIHRNQANKKQITALQAAFQAQRQDILLQAKEICLDIIMLNQLTDILKRRMEYANELDKVYDQMLIAGDATSIEVNKIKLEKLNLQTEYTINTAALKKKKTELAQLNGNIPLEFNNSDYPNMALPTYELVKSEALGSNYNLEFSQYEYEAAVKQIAVSKAGWLPNLAVGYKRNSGAGFHSNGIAVGVSIPIFNNRGKVSSAKAAAVSKSYSHDLVKTKLESDLYQAYQEAAAMREQIDIYQSTLDIDKLLGLLQQALQGGEMSMTAYFVELATAYQSLENYIQISNIYQKQVAQLYKHRL